MDRWAWEQLAPRADGPIRTAGRRTVLCAARTDSRAAVLCREYPSATAQRASRGWRSATVRSHQLRHAHAVEMPREGVPLVVIQRQLQHADLGITSVYLRGIDNTEIIHAVHELAAPMIPATHGLAIGR